MRLKELREERNITQNEIAKAIKTSQTNIGRWEKGLNEPSATHIISLCNFFKCSADYLLGRENDFGIVNIENNHTPKEQKLLKVFNLLDNDEQEKIIEDCEYFANKHTIKNTSQRRA